MRLASGGRDKSHRWGRESTLFAGVVGTGESMSKSSGPPKEPELWRPRRKTTPDSRVTFTIARIRPQLSWTFGEDAKAPAKASSRLIRVFVDRIERLRDFQDPLDLRVIASASREALRPIPRRAAAPRVRW